MIDIFCWLFGIHQHKWGKWVVRHGTLNSNYGNKIELSVLSREYSDCGLIETKDIY